MTPLEAEQLGVKEADRGRYVRMDDAKANLAPRAPRARWMRLDAVPLGNATDPYPSGDHVAAITPWVFDSPWAAHTADRLNEVLDAIAAGPAAGAPFTPSRRGGVSGRWGGTPLVAMLGVTKAQAAAMLETWLRNGVLRSVPYRDPAQRRERLGLDMVDAKRPGRVVIQGDTTHMTHTAPG